MTQPYTPFPATSGDGMPQQWAPSRPRFNPPPTWPQPPLGWEPPPGWAPPVMWPPAPPGWQFWVSAAPVTPYGVHDPRPQRSDAVRTLMVLGILIGWFAITFVIGLAVGSTVDASAYPTQAAYSQALSDRLAGVQGLVVLVAVAAMALLSPRVSYRWFDCFQVLVPVWNVVYVCRILWRTCSLPVRYWTPRPDELRRR